MFKALITTCLLTFSSCTGIGNDYQYKEQELKVNRHVVIRALNINYPLFY